jgi:hypothetical protein
VQKWNGIVDTSNFPQFSTVLAGGKAIVKTMYEPSAAMVTGKNIYHFGFQLSLPTGINSLSLAELLELQAYMVTVLNKNLLTLAQQR